MQQQLWKVIDFHQSFRQPYSKIPTLLPMEECTLRHDLMKEENVEYLIACGEGNITEIADALGDQLYILLGTIIKHGMQDVIADVFREIHDSNMTKLGEDGLPILREDGKILKGPNYKKPNIKQFFYNEHS